jgi:hypothetical protein
MSALDELRPGLDISPSRGNLSDTMAVEGFVLAFKIIWSGFSLIFVGIGLYFMNRGRKLRGQSKRIAATETTQIRDLQPGAAEVKGAAHPAEDASIMQSPMTGADALATHVMVEKYQSSSQGGGSWTTIHEAESAVPIMVDDGTAEVRVELPSDGELNLDLIRKTVGGGEEPPEPIRRFVEQEADVDEATRHDLGLLSVGERRRYSEGVLEPGEGVYVLGTARETAGWDGQEYVIDEPTQSGDFVLSDKSEDTLTEEGRWGGGFMLVVGAVATAMATLFTVAPWLVL